MGSPVVSVSKTKYIAGGNKERESLPIIEHN